MDQFPLSPDIFILKLYVWKLTSVNDFCYVFSIIFVTPGLYRNKKTVYGRPKCCSWCWWLAPLAMAFQLLRHRIFRFWFFLKKSISKKKQFLKADGVIKPFDPSVRNFHNSEGARNPSAFWIFTLEAGVVIKFNYNVWLGIVRKFWNLRWIEIIEIVVLNVFFFV